MDRVLVSATGETTRKDEAARARCVIARFGKTCSVEELDGLYRRANPAGVCAIVPYSPASRILVGSLHQGRYA